MKPLLSINPSTGHEIRSYNQHSNEEIENIQHAVAESLGYKLVDHRLELYGIKIKK